MKIPKTFKVRPTRLLDRCGEDDHQRCEHYIAGPARTTAEIGEKEAFEAQIVFRGELGKVVPVSNRMNPCEEDD